jgi:hypothetical protein
MFKSNFDQNTGGWLAGWIDRPSIMSLKKSVAQTWLI